MATSTLIRFQIEGSRLVISVVGEAGTVSKRIERDTASLDRMDQLAHTYRGLIALRTFAEEEGEAFLGILRSFGEQLYQLFFAGLDDFLDAETTLILEHSILLFPLELAHDGTEFLGLRFATGNVIRRTGWLPFAALELEVDHPYLGAARPPLSITFLGREGDEVLQCFQRDRRWHAWQLDVDVPASELRRSLFDKRNDILHFAGHGEYHVSPGEGDRAKLTFGPGSQGSYVDFSELLLQAARQRPNLVFLNSCQSGKVRENYLGFLGLGEEFLRAGANGCVSTQWSIVDEDASRFATYFYESLLSGEPAGESLRRARSRCWSEGRGALTSLAYVLLGDPRIGIASKTVSKPTSP